MRGIALSSPAAGPLEALGAAIGRGPAFAVDDPDLPVVATVVAGCEALDDLFCAEPFAQQGEAVGPVTGIRVGLGCDRADTGLRPGDDRADGEELRLRCDAPLTGLRVAGGDRVRGDEQSPSHT